MKPGRIIEIENGRNVMDYNTLWSIQDNDNSIRVPTPTDWVLKDVLQKAAQQSTVYNINNGTGVHIGTTTIAASCIRNSSGIMLPDGEYMINDTKVLVKNRGLTIIPNEEKTSGIDYLKIVREIMANE